MTVVVKIGGARAVDPAGAVTDVAHLTVNDEDVVVVHGGSTAVDDALDRMGKEPDYVESPSGVTGRFTDTETMEIFEMAMGKVNTDLVAAFENAGVPAVGLNGVDGKLLSGPRKSAVRVVKDGKKKIRRGEHSGTIEDVNTDLLAAQLDAGYVPVVSVPMFARESEDGEEWTPVNADADRAAAAVAGALDATLVVLTDVEGVYADPDDPESLIEEVLTPEDLDGAKDAAEGFMTKKVLAATEALEGGAESVVVSDANRRDPIVAALEGAGTRFSPEALP
ncbi:acetylglutamate/acetylaminoadipate kinase [Halobacterium hubeiense]|uniref:acetylglutamate/acetylaminoadipate kinase n=1 Tax=Halobacterium hubeiense TaxID=1407499 RepID=UPI003C793C16